MENNQPMPGAGAPQSGLLDNGRTWLNTAAVVDRLVRDFARETLDQVGRPDFMEWLDGRCRFMNGLFLGGSASTVYERGPWNAPDQLGEYILHAMQINGEPRLAVRDAFMVFFSRLLKATDGEFDSAALEALVGELRDSLLGLKGAV